MSEYISVEKVGAVLKLGFNRPEKKNAINLAMYAALAANIQNAAGDTELRCIVLHGTENCFTGGNDLADFLGAIGSTVEDNPIIDFMDALKGFPKPIIAAVDGVAIGIGTTLLLHCDMVFASENATFSLPFAKLGLCPEFAASYLVPALVGHQKACEWLMLGESFSAAEAAEGGIVNRVVADTLAEALAVAEKLSAMAPQALLNTKSLLKAGLQAQLDKVIESELDVFQNSLKGPEFAEAVAAFFEKRQAVFK